MSGCIAAPSWWLGQSEAQPYSHTIYLYIANCSTWSSLLSLGLIFVRLSRVLDLS